MNIENKLEPRREVERLNRLELDRGNGNKQCSGYIQTTLEPCSQKVDEG